MYVCCSIDEYCSQCDFHCSVSVVSLVLSIQYSSVPQCFVYTSVCYWVQSSVVHLALGTIVTVNQLNLVNFNPLQNTLYVTG